MKAPQKQAPKYTPAKGGLRGGQVMPAAKYRAPMKGSKNATC